MKKLICIILCILMLLPAVVACGDKTDDPTGGTTTPSGATTGDPNVDGPSEITSISVKDLSKYTIIYPDAVSDDLKAQIDSLRSMLVSSYGATISVKSDFITPGEYEILIGNTNRAETAKFLEGKRSKDYGYGIVGKKLVIGAADDHAATEAVSEFMLKIVMNGKPNDTVFFDASMSSNISGVYTVDTLKLNGIDISEFSIVYPKANTAFESALALKVMYAVRAVSGAILPIKDDSEAYADGYEILIGKTNRTSAVRDDLAAGEGCIGVMSSGKQFEIYGQTAAANAVAVEKFCAMLEPKGEEKTLDVDVKTEKVAALRENGSLTTGTFNVYTSDVTDVRAERVIGTILSYLPDTIGLQETKTNWLKRFEEVFATYYTVVGEGREGATKGEYNPIFYATEKFDLLDSGTQWLSDTPTTPSKLAGAEYHRIFTWALLERKADKVKFLHVNTHLDTAGTDIRQKEVTMLREFLAGYSDVAVVLTGDFNCKSDSAEYKALVSGMLSDSRDIAAVKVIGDYQNIIDHIFVQDNYIDVLKYQVAYERFNGDYASDHRAMFAEYIINYNGTDFIPPDGGASEPSVDNEGKELGDIVVPGAMQNSGIINVIPDGQTTFTLEGIEYTVLRTVEEFMAIHKVAGNYILANDIDFGGQSYTKLITLEKGSRLEGNGCALLNYVLEGDVDICSIGFNNNEVITLKNLTLGSANAPISVTSTGSGKSVGALLGYSNSMSYIENVTVYANVSSPNSNVGGVIGNIKGTHTFKNIVFHGTVEGSNAGGIFGRQQSTATIENCINYGTITGLADTGGIAGNHSGDGNSIVIGCKNFGRVSSSKNAAGFSGSVSGTLSLNNFLNAGTISGGDIVGGIVAYMGGSSMSFEKCINTASVTNIKGGITGGIIGRAATASGFTMKDCASFGPVVSTGENVGAYVGSSDDGVQMSAGSTGNKYVEVANGNNTGIDTTGRVDVEMVAGELAILTGIDFVKTSNNAFFVAAPKLVAIQEGTNAAGARPIRLVAVVNANDMTQLGFKVTVKVNGVVQGAVKDINGNVVYSRINGKDGSTKSAGELGGEYIYALIIENIPSGAGEVSLTITPYAVGSATYNGETVEIVFVNGALVGTK